jgi:hypothetical protein
VTSIDATQRKLIVGIVMATLIVLAIVIADLASGGRPDPPTLRAGLEPLVPATGASSASRNRAMVRPGHAADDNPRGGRTARPPRVLTDERG